MNRSTPALLLLLLVGAPQPGCVCPPWMCSWEDDDDDRRDDDDDVVDDDDDDAVGALDSMTFSMTFRATEAAGDDDDSAGDDDDSAANVARADISGELVARYEDEDGGLLCEQHVAFDGDAWFDGAPDCSGCTGFLQIRASSVEDVSSPFLDDDHCDPAEASELGLDYAVRLLRPAGIGGLGDFLSIALVDVETALDADLAFAPDADLTYAAQAERLADDGLVLTHGGYLRSTDGGLVEGAGIDQVAGTPAAGDPWFGFWRLFADPNLNSYDGAELRGRYGAQSVWRVYPR